jgi:hypothetical protein
MIAPTPNTYQQPTLFDFQRNLDAIIHGGEQQARAKAAQTKSEFIARGMGSSTSVISAVIGQFNELHRNIIEQSMTLINEFAISSAQLSLAALAGAAHPRLDGFATMLLSALPPAGFPQEAQRIRTQYAAVFRQRLEGALKDIQIGFIGGRKVTAVSAALPPAPAVASAEQADKLMDALILRPTFMGVGVDLQKAWKWVGDKWRALH